MIDQDKINIIDFKGWYQRLSSVITPLGYAKDFTNLVVGDRSIKARPGLTFFANQPGVWTNILRIWIAGPDASSLFVLSGTSVYYSFFGGAAILTGLPAGSDINILKVFGKYFITVHNRTNGILFNYYVFDPSIHTVARAALGNGAGSAITVANGSAGSKNVSTGLHIWGVTFETDSGHITGLGIIALTSFTHNGTTRANLSAIPIGPAGTSARHILVTKVIPNYDGNLVNYQLFFLPNGRIADNTTTVLNNVEFFDSELQDDADYLKDIFGQIFAPLGMCIYSNRVILWGRPTTEHEFLASDIGKPESFSSVSGAQEVDKDFGTGIQVCFEYKGLLAIIKDTGTYITKDNGGEPNTWEIVRVSNLLGAYVYGVCRLSDGQPGPIGDIVIMFNRSGLHIFDGQFREIPLSRNIDDFIDTLNLNATDMKKCQCFADFNSKRIYISLVATTGQEPKVLLVCDFRDGLSPDTVKWYKFVFYHEGSANSVIRSIHSMPIATAIGYPSLLVAEADQVLRLDNSYTADVGVDDTTKYQWSFESGEIPLSDSLDDNQYVTGKILAKKFTTPNTTNVNIQLGSSPAQVWTMLTSEVAKDFNFNLVALRPTLFLSSVQGNEAYPEYIKHIMIYGKSRAVRRPL